MQLVTFKLQERILKQVDSILKPLNFNNRTEFIREAIREKLKKIEEERFLQTMIKFKGSVKKHITDAELRKAREKAFNELTAKFR